MRKWPRRRCASSNWRRSGAAWPLLSDVAPAAGQIFADRRAVKQILVNLLSNGVKFTPRGGEVRLSARLIDRGVEIMVRDTGTGISKSDLEKLGKPFEQAEGAAARSKEGTGLGLALVKSLTAYAWRRNACWNRRWGSAPRSGSGFPMRRWVPMAGD